MSLRDVGIARKIELPGIVVFVSEDVPPHTCALIVGGAIATGIVVGLTAAAEFDKLRDQVAKLTTPPDVLAGIFREFLEGPNPRWTAYAVAVESGNDADADELVETLLDLVKQGRREDFDDLAAARGLKPETLEPLWDGTRRRLKLEP